MYISFIYHPENQVVGWVLFSWLKKKYADVQFDTAILENQWYCTKWLH